MIRKTCFWITAVLMYCTIFSILWDIVDSITNNGRSLHIRWLHEKFFGYSPTKYRITEDNYNYYIERKKVFNKWTTCRLSSRMRDYIPKDEMNALEETKRIYNMCVDNEKRMHASKHRTVVKLPEDTPLYRTLNG